MSDYSIAVKLGLVDDVSKGLAAIAKQMTLLGKETSDLQIAMQQMRMHSGATFLAFGVGLVTPLIAATNQAGKLQQQLLFVQNATHASNLEMEAFRGTVERAAGSSAQSSISVATMAKTLATGFQLPLDQISKLLPMFSQYALNQQQMKGTNPQTAVMQGIQLAHLSGHDDVASIKKDLDLLTQLNYIMPGDITKVLQAQKYAQGTLGNIMGVTQKDTMLLIATLNRFGVEGTRAGSQLLSAISRSIPGVMWSGLLPGQSAQSLSKMGLTDATGKPLFFDQSGKFNVEKWMSTLSTFVKRERSSKDPATATAEIMKAFQYSMGVTGTRLAAVLSSDLGIKEFEKLKSVLETMPNLDEQTKNLQTLLSVQQMRFWKDLQNTFTEMGYSILPDLTVVLSTFSDSLESLTHFMETHPLLTSRIEDGILAFAGLSVIGGTLLLLKVGFTGLLLPMKILKTMLPYVTAEFTAVTVPIMLLGSAFGLIGYAAYKLYTEFGETKAAFWQLWSAFKNNAIYHTIASGIKLLNTELGQFGHTITGITNSIKNILPFWGAPNALAGGLKTGVNASHYLNSQLPQKIANTIKGSSLLDIGFPPLQAIKSIFHVIKAGSNQAGSLIKNNATNQPIHVHLNVDGRKMASVVATHIYNGATGMPNSSSHFDTNLSPMPSVANAIGIA